MPVLQQSRSPFSPEHMQYYNIEIGRLADGMIAVS
jgi:hypothetical protein